VEEDRIAYNPIEELVIDTPHVSIPLDVKETHFGDLATKVLQHGK
jgi:hypothetical protein